MPEVSETFGSRLCTDFNCTDPERMAHRANPGGRKMKKLSLISLAAAAVLAISPAALVAQQVDFTFTTDNGAASGTGIFDITEVGTSDVYQIADQRDFYGHEQWLGPDQ